MKYRIAVVLLIIPCVAVDLMLWPLSLMNWFITGHAFEPLLQQLIEQPKS